MSSENLTALENSLIERGFNLSDFLVDGKLDKSALLNYLDNHSEADEAELMAWVSERTF
jgi:hypothetical protein